jgi:response regulator RpfG family c-di-GMP phosphodiesterase
MANFLFDKSKKIKEVVDTSPTLPPWEILIIDDEIEVHSVTRLALSSFKFEGKAIDISSAYSAQEAKVLLEQPNNFAMALVDVVMETETAGLDLIKYIRGDLHNHDIRLVLRTGQPGQAPEHEVISNYDINDYKAKTELTAQKLYTLLHSTLRSYRDIATLRRSRVGLTHLVKSARQIFQLTGFLEFVHSTLEQLANLINVSHSFVFTADSSAFSINKLKLEPICGTGRFNNLIEIQKMSEWPTIQQAILNKESIYNQNEIVIYCENQQHTMLFYSAGFDHIDGIDRELLNLFADNIIIALDNIRLHEACTIGNKTVVERLAEAIEQRANTKPTHHIVSVAKMCKRLAILAQQNSDFCQLIELAAPLHDVGKISVPSQVLSKSSKLDDAEWQQIKQYPNKGFEILNSDDSEMMIMAADIAQSLHEKYNGLGYPNQLKGEDIPLSARICALCNTTDVMLSGTHYQEATGLEQCKAELLKERGESFDPVLVDLILQNFDEILDLRK